MIGGVRLRRPDRPPPPAGGSMEDPPAVRFAAPAGEVGGAGYPRRNRVKTRHAAAGASAVGRKWRLCGPVLAACGTVHGIPAAAGDACLIGRDHAGFGGGGPTRDGGAGRTDGGGCGPISPGAPCLATAGRACRGGLPPRLSRTNPGKPSADDASAFYVPYVVRVVFCGAPGTRQDAGSVSGSCVYAVHGGLLGHGQRTDRIICRRMAARSPGKSQTSEHVADPQPNCARVPRCRPAAHPHQSGESVFRTGCRQESMAETNACRHQRARDRNRLGSPHGGRGSPDGWSGPVVARCRLSGPPKSRKRHFPASAYGWSGSKARVRS